MEKDYSNGITILLGLKGHNINIGEIREDGNEIIVEVATKGRQGSCIYCGSKRLYRHERCRIRKVLHSWSNGKRIYLKLHRRRWRCCNCKRTFCEGRNLVRPYFRITRQAERELLWQLKERSFNQIKRELGISYSTLRSLLEKTVKAEMTELLKDKDRIYLGIDEHSFRHQELVYTITEVKERKMIAILKDDKIATLKEFLKKIPEDKVEEVCIDMKQGLKKATEEIFTKAKVVVDPFHVISDANKRMDEARRIEQELHPGKIRIPKKIFLISRDKLSEEKRNKLDELLKKHPSLKGFYWAKENILKLYRQKTHKEASKLLNNIILNLESSDDAELVRWAYTLKRWYDPILNYFDNHTTNGFTEGCHTKIKMLKRISFGLKNMEVYCRKMILGFLSLESCFHTL